MTKGGKIGIGIIGCGDIAAKSFAPSLARSSHAELVAVCRRDLSKAKEFAQRFPNPKSQIPNPYSSPSALLADPCVEAVIVATPPDSHREITLLAAERGKHVLCEKPMALNAAECREMIAACREANVKLAVAYRRRMSNQVREAQRLIAAGRIGRVVCVRTHYSGWYSATPDESWRLVPAVGGGGVLMDMAVHRIEVLLNFGGRPLEVAALVETVHHDWPVDDSCGLVLKFESGAIGVTSTIWTSPPRHDFAQIDGTLGRIILDPFEFTEGQIRLETPQGIESIPVEPLVMPFYDMPMIDDFCLSIREDREPLCHAEAGYWTQATADVAYASAREKRTVAVGQRLEATDDGRLMS